MVPIKITYAMKKASKSFVSLVVRIFFCCAAENFPCGFDFYYKYLGSCHTRPPDLQKGLGLFHFFFGSN